MAMITTRDRRIAEIVAARQKRDRAPQRRIPNDAWAELRRIGSMRVDLAGHASPEPERLTDGLWTGQRCFIVAGGPSLKGFNFGRLAGERTIAINRAVESCPDADIAFAFDPRVHQAAAAGDFGDAARTAFAAFRGIKVCLYLDSAAAHLPGVFPLGCRASDGYPVSLADGVFHGGNSGYAALQLALLLGANPIYLLGYDMTGEGGKQARFYGGYPWGDGSDRVYVDFKGRIEKLAPEIAAHGVRVVNLNSGSALRCFEFGDVDRVLPMLPPAGKRVTVITPTGDRPLAFGLCWRWMAAQTRKPDQWLIIDDGAGQPGNLGSIDGVDIIRVRRVPLTGEPRHTLALNLKAALPLIDGDIVLVMEDDEYYAPQYIETMARRLDRFEIVGICRSKYYHLPTGKFQQIGNTGHASLAQTGFRSSFLPIFTGCVERGMETNWVDQQIWQIVGERKLRAQLFVDDGLPLYCGMKGLPGRPGIGQGHKEAMYREQDTPDRARLRAWIPCDFQAYLDILEGGL